MNISDYHVHTFLSPCAVRNAIPAKYLELCSEKGITDIGFADHLWDETVPGAFGWYQNQTIDQILSIKNNILSNYAGVNIHYGCEAEMDKNNVISISKENRALFDYVLVATSHFHMRGYTIESGLKDLNAVRGLLISRFIKACESGVASGIAHPFLAFGFFDTEYELLKGISDNEYITCFKTAADTNVSVELNGILATKREMPEENGFAIEYIRMFTLAGECGCRFHLGSDCHNPNDFNVHKKLMELASICGISIKPLV